MRKSMKAWLYLYDMHKIKQPLTIGLDFAQRYKLGVHLDTTGTLYLWYDRWKIATKMKKGNSERQAMTMNETKLTDKQERDKNICVVTNHTVTISPYHISIVPLTPINQIRSIYTNIPLQIEDSLFISINQPNIAIIPTLQELESFNMWQIHSNLMESRWSHNNYIKEHDNLLCERL